MWRGQRRSISCVKRLQITIEDDLYDLLTLEAYRTGTSKAAVVRDCLRERLRPTPLPPIEEDPLWELVGIVDGDPVADIDEFLYGPRAEN
jgi:Ribbon-helix-helix protein, copG family